MPLYHATVMHTPTSPFASASALTVRQDAGVLVQDGVIRAVGSFTELHAAHPDEPSVDVRGGVLLPGFVDTHVHYPQVRVLGGLGMPLLEWLDRNTLPEEARFGDGAYARQVAREFLRSLASHGTTTALVFGSHFATAMHEFFDEAAASRLRIVAGQVVSDRLLRPELHTTPERAFTEGHELIRQYHGRGRLLYAVTPRFSLSASEGILEACAALLREHGGVRFTSHLNENDQEIRAVRELFPWSRDYLDTYERYGLVTRLSVFAHNVHPTDRELGSMCAHGASVSHCPCSNSALGSGLFPMRRHVMAGVRVALGTDVGGGTGFGVLKEGLQANFMQNLHADGYSLTPAHLLYLATRAGAEAVGLQDVTGDFSVGKAFDAVLIQPAADTPLGIMLRHADSAERALAAIFTLGSAADVRRVWVGGDAVHAADAVGVEA